VLYADSSFYLVRVTAPTALMIVASGIEIGRQVTEDRQQVTYAGGPMRDFYLAASARYSVVSEQVGQTTVNSYAPSELVEEAKIALGYTVDALKTFNGRFGAYPFTEFDVVSTPTRALGIEYPGIVAIAVRIYDRTQSEYPLTYLESTIAHEVGHQWFYSVVGNDQLDEPWLDEAVTQYVTLLYWQDLHGRSGAAGFRDSLEKRWERVDRAEIPIGMPVRAYSGDEYGAIVYGRGPLFVEVLAKKMGQETFDAFLRDYYETHKWGIATADSLKQLAESHGDCDLDQLFADWVYEQ
jgi:aminopeptidase N